MPRVSHYVVESSRNLRAISPAELPSDWTGASCDYVTLIVPDGGESPADWLGASDFSWAAPPDMADPDEDAALIQRHPDSVYIQYPTNWDNSARSKAYLSLLCLPHRLIALPSASVLALEKVIEDAGVPGRLRGADLGAALIHLIFVYAKAVSVDLRQLRNDIADVEGMTSGSGSALVPERDAETQMRRLWPQVTAMLDLVDDQAFVVRTLRELTSPALNLKPYEETLDDLTADSDYAYRVAMRLEARYRLLGERLESVQAEITDRRLRVLTIVSAVFLPLTLITGYFGMNFIDMPLLRVPNATVFLLAAMFAVTVGLLVYFKRSDWL